MNIRNNRRYINNKKKIIKILNKFYFNIRNKLKINI